jgi:hypothetical protein
VGTTHVYPFKIKSSSCEKRALLLRGNSGFIRSPLLFIQTNLMLERAQIGARKKFFSEIAAPAKVFFLDCAGYRQNKPPSHTKPMQFAQIGDKERL